MYPNGKADVNQFHSNGGMSFIVSTLIENGLIHRDVPTIVGENLDDYVKAPSINDAGELEWNPISCKNADSEILITGCTSPPVTAGIVTSPCGQMFAIGNV